jgi:hypothetical protein
MITKGERATLWEIHPILNFEVWEGGGGRPSATPYGEGGRRARPRSGSEPARHAFLESVEWCDAPADVDRPRRPRLLFSLRAPLLP